MAERDPRSAQSRREFLTAAAGTCAAPLAYATATPTAAATGTSIMATGQGASKAIETVALPVNGQLHRLALDPRTTLLDALRDHIGLTGTKKGCDHGQCGACTVHIDGHRALSCMTFAVMAEGRAVTTIEGLAEPGGRLHPMQQAFVDHDAFQCGYCTPGQIMSAIACIKEGHASSEADIREFMSGNLCRCAAYPNIVAAIVQARAEMQEL